ncbi:ROK family transcriptional regulator [Kiloniella laminariae]|uniref:ROK family transcriptional regulator n=1 Tax=Kiloniella laminariae TaxID=454162 RepID=UPI00036CEE30|nr:ROK family transcriptional regulator [Kiloniella laminariae]
MARRGTNLEQTKAQNLRLVLSQIRSGDAISRADIAKNTGLTRQTISNLTNDLIAVGLLEELGLKKSGAGKPSRLLGFSAKGAFSIGVRVGRSKIEASLCDLAGDVLETRVLPFQEPTEVELVSLLECLCLDLIRPAGTDIRRIVGIGLIMAEPSDFAGEDEGPQIFPQTVARSLSEELHLPVMLETAAAAAALAEFLQGSARDFQNFIYLFIGQEISAGLMADGKIYGGRSGRSGSIGHLVVNIKGPLCACGNPGCLNGYVSLGTLSRHLEARGRSGEDIFKDCTVDDPTILAWLGANAEYLRIGVNALENLYDPETIILGGDAPEWFLEAVIRHLRPFMRSVSEKGEREIPRLVRSPKAEQMVQKGAATLPVFAAFGSEDDTYRKGECFGDPYARLSALIEGLSSSIK